MAIPKTMHAVYLLGNGGCEQLEYRSDVPVPRPGPTDILIRVTAAGVNNTGASGGVGSAAVKLVLIPPPLDEE